MNNPKLTVVIPTYLPTGTIRPTLDALHSSIRTWTRDSYTLVLSDSSQDERVSNETRDWARKSDVELIVDHSLSRRITKVALNVAFSKPEVASADLVLIINDDVLLRVNAVEKIIETFLRSPQSVIAVGSVLPDPLFSHGRRRAGAWQIRLNNGIAKRLPRVFPRAEGAFWLSRGSFLSNFRFRIGEESIADDVALVDYLVSQGMEVLNVHEAVALKIPTEGFGDFSRQTRRGQAASSTSGTGQSLFLIKLRAMFFTILRDPVGFFCYFAYRSGMALSLKEKVEPDTEEWVRVGSTFR